MEETNNKEETIAPVEGAVETKEGTEHIVTQEDLDANPGLAETGIKVGDKFGYDEIAGDVEGHLTSEQITPEMREAGIDETTPIVTRETMVEELGEDAVKKIEEEAVDATIEEQVADIVAEIPTKEQKVFEKLSVSTEGRTYAGKDVIEARWDREKLVIKDVDNVEFTLSGEELEKFLG